MAATLLIKMAALSSGKMSRRKELKGKKKGQKCMFPPFKDLFSKMSMSILLTSHWPEFNYMATSSMKETGEFCFYPRKLNVQLASGSFMIKEEEEMNIKEKLSFIIYQRTNRFH